SRGWRPCRSPTRSHGRASSCGRRSGPRSRSRRPGSPWPGSAGTRTRFAPGRPARFGADVWAGPRRPRPVPGRRRRATARLPATARPVSGPAVRLAFARMPKRPRLLVLNQYYWPGVEATANLLTELCEALAETHDVTVITGASRGQPRRQERNGVEIVRVRSTAYDRAHLWGRALNYVSYALGVVAKAMFTRRPDLVVCMTDPPFLASIARLVHARFRVPLLIVMQDVFPEVAVRLG